MLSSRESKKGVLLTPLNTSRLEGSTCKKGADLLMFKVCYSESITHSP
jgi:hypothetical protein